MKEQQFTNIHCPIRVLSCPAVVNQYKNYNLTLTQILIQMELKGIYSTKRYAVHTFNFRMDIYLLPLHIPFFLFPSLTFNLPFFLVPISTTSPFSLPFPFHLQYIFFPHCSKLVRYITEVIFGQMLENTVY